MKPEPYRLQVVNYPFVVEIQTRYGDLDSLGHINNVSFARLIEEARLRFGLQLRGMDRPSEIREQARVVLVSNRFEYLSEAHYPEPVVVGCGVMHVGRSSYTIGAAMFQGERCVAVNDSTLVHAEGGVSHPLPQELRRALEANRLRGD